MQKLSSIQRGETPRGNRCGIQPSTASQLSVAGPREATLLRDAHKHDWAEAVVEPAPIDESVWLADTSGSCAEDTLCFIEGKQQIQPRKGPDESWL